ncbi:hypothetical protein J2S74_004040 [Evansella vedderi]|uniref:Uncharacterized protein n=1 Tax=Evansella vedderi TaxID=38282 RepID=A0ABT9ZZF6_9BACI|nr:hypothetical protein [Evansella vedderi]
MIPKRESRQDLGNIKGKNDPEKGEQQGIG